MLGQDLCSRDKCMGCEDTAGTVGGPRAVASRRGFSCWRAVHSEPPPGRSPRGNRRRCAYTEFAKDTSPRVFGEGGDWGEHGGKREPTRPGARRAGRGSAFGGTAPLERRRREWLRNAYVLVYARRSPRPPPPPHPP